MADADTIETLRVLGIGTGQTLSPEDLKTIESLGIQFKPVKGKSDLPPTKPLKRVYTPEEKKEAESLGFSSSIVSGMPIIGPLEELSRAAVRAGMSSGGTFGDRFRHTFEQQKGGEQLYNEQHPISAPIGNVLGGLVTMGPLAATKFGGAMMGTYGPTLGSKVATGALGNATISGTDAALRGDNPLTGAGIGFVGGAAAPLIGEGARALTRLLASAAWPSPGMMRNVPGPAKNKLVEAISGETPASIADARARMGPHGFLSDLNTGMTDLAGGIADTPGPAKQQVREAYRLRDKGQRDRIEDAITDALGPRINLANVTRREKVDRADAARPLYEAWENTRVTPTPRLKKLTEELEDEGILKEANRLLKAEGKPTYEKHFTPGSRNEWPTAEAWDYAKQAIDGKIEKALREGDGNSVRVYSKLKKRITDAIDNHPDDRISGVWKAARETWANPTAIMNARKMGADVWNPKTRVDELAYTLTDFTGPERAAFRQGARDELAQMIDASTRGDTSVRNKLLAPSSQEKLLWISPNGKPKAEKLIRSLESEEYLKGQSTNVRGGSQTTPKKERVDALKPSALPEYNPKLTEPLSLIPPHILEQLRPSNILEAWRGAHHTNANNDLARLLLTPEPQLDQLLPSLLAESARQARIERGSRPVGNALSTLIGGPGTTTARRQYLPAQ